MDSAPTVFISYSHEDEVWKDHLVFRLAPLEQQGLLQAWKDHADQSASEWFAEIQDRAAMARIIVLLLSSSYLSRRAELSDFLGYRLGNTDTSIFPVLCEPCDWSDIYWFAKVPIFPEDRTPLALLPSDRADLEITKVAQEIIRLAIPLDSGSSSSSSRRPAAPQRKSPSPSPAAEPPPNSPEVRQISGGVRSCLLTAVGLFIQSRRKGETPLVDPILLLAGCALHGSSSRMLGFYTPRFLADDLRRQKRGARSLVSILELSERYGITSDTIELERDIPIVLNPEASRTLSIARYFGQETYGNREIHTRHLIAALLTEDDTPQGPPPLEAPEYLRRLGFDVAELRARLLEQLLQNVSEDNPAAWRGILEDRQPPSRPVPGYVSDSVGGRDQLGISEEVNALCAVAMAREFKPPLSIGLFGDWGSGKSFFMGMMRERIELLADCARSSEEKKEPTSYCSHVAQITFNAWHYIDADLWASLVTKIWEDLAQFIAKTHPEDPDVKTRALREQLKEGGDRVAEAERIARETEEKRKDLETRISALEEEKGKRSEELAHLSPKVIASLVLDRPGVREPLAEAADKIGLPAAQAATRDTLDTLVGLAGRVRTLLRWVFQGPNWGKRLLMVVLPVLVSAAVGAGVYWLSHDQTGTVQKLLTGLSAAAALVVQAVTWLKPWLLKVSDAWSQLEKVKEEIDRAAEERRTEIRREEEALQQDLTRLRANEAKLQGQIAEDRERIRRLEEEIRKAQGPRDVGEFIQAQVISQEYQGRLGFIAKVRRDFDRLNQLMVSDGIEPRPADLPQIDRIILYVDDLDRCPGDRVVQVLEAVHLLLAMPLFVVVVGVDPRWLLRSLEEHYSEFLVSKDSHEGLLEEDEVSDWASTPLHYLEKIFQIPFTLQPMAEDGFTRLVRSMVQTQPVRPQTAAMPSAGTQGAAPEPSPAAPPGTEPAPSTSESATASPESAYAPATPPAATLRLDPSPPSLEIDPLEVEFMSHLAPLIHSPRSAKRFVNIYRLIRAQLDRRELYDFVGTSDAPGEHRAVLVMLAVLVGFPDQASWMLRGLRDKAGKGSWWEMVEGLAPLAGKSGLYINAYRDDITESERRTWLKLQACLEGLREKTKLPDKVAVYRKWVTPVARFSFKSGRLVSAGS